MLRAHLEHKLGRALARALADAGNAERVDGSLRTTLHGDEDALTSSVFERLSYLDPPTAWAVLRNACLASGQDSFPPFPAGETQWHFWPSLTPASGDKNESYVEPDILLVMPGYAVILESKHRASQYFGQWVSQVRAVRASHPTFQVLHVSVGGCSMAHHQEESRRAQLSLAGYKEHPASFFYLSWHRLGTELLSVLQLPKTHAGYRRLVQTILVVLEAWGYGLGLWLQSLPSPSVSLNSTVLSTWKPCYNRAIKPDLARLPLTGITRIPKALLEWSVR